MARVASNEKFETSRTIIIFIIIWILATLIVTILNDEVLINIVNKDNTNWYITYDQTMSIRNLFNIQSILLTVIIVLYLLYTIISVTYIVNVFEGPIRKKS